ncbi:unnamed protein product [Lactuca saligna]|uniref:RING-type domain-containing protein n=1 Tax=Lactuca saligna TaxID=75948 RepID=A0AA36EA69_LACSI|nr:unnamed protein product [Lactuca saligna]
MGSACCVAARDRRAITNGSSSDVIPRNIRYSPSWGVRWENRRRVAGEEASMTWYSDSATVATNDRLDNKSQTTVGTAYASEEGSPLESFRNLTWQKSSPSEGYPVPQSEAQSLSKNPTKLSSPSTQTPFSASPPPPRHPTCSPGRQVSHSRIPSTKSSNLSISEEGPGSGWSNELNRGSSDGWSISIPIPIPVPVPASNESFDSESLNFKMSRSSGGVSSIDMQTCGACSKLLSEKSSWGTQKIIANNELAVVAILICGHVYHAECLENMTDEINKYDPACPVCTFGEKQTFKMSEKAIKAEMELKAKISRKKSRTRSRVVDGDDDDDDDDVIMFDNSGSKSRSHNHNNKMSSSSSMKNSMGKPKTPFLKRHFSFGGVTSPHLFPSKRYE